MLTRPRTVAFLTLALAALLAGCMPSAVTFHFGDVEGTLHESVVGGDSTAPASSKIIVIDVRGLIVDAPEPGFIVSGRNPVAELAARLKEAAADKDVKAIVLRVNSPGGGVAASETMYNEIRRFREKTSKPVVVSMGDVAASGGYYISLAADKIIAQPTTITASIGVIMPTVNFSGGLAKLGIVSRSIKSGKNKDLANPLEPMRDEQYAVLQGVIDEFYARFRNLVIERRPGLDKSRLDELTDGRVVTGASAVKAGLVDAEGDVYTAFEEAKRLAGAKEAQMVKYYRGYEAPRTPFATAGEYAGADQPAEHAAARAADVNIVQLNLGGPFGDAALTSGGVYYLWTPPGL